MPKRIEYSPGDFIGDHGLIYLEDAEPAQNGKDKRRSTLLCICGEAFTCRTSSAVSGRTGSCGCAKREKQSESNTKHGLRFDPLYRTWDGMKQRCLNPESKGFGDYGERGISIHEPWVNDAAAFISWINDNLGPRPDGYTLDRIDPDGHYVPDNLRWADWSTQNTNKRKVVR